MPTRRKRTTRRRPLKKRNTKRIRKVKRSRKRTRKTKRKVKRSRKRSRKRTRKTKRKIRRKVKRSRKRTRKTTRKTRRKVSLIGGKSNKTIEPRIPAGNVDDGTVMKGQDGYLWMKQNGFWTKPSGMKQSELYSIQQKQKEAVDNLKIDSDTGNKPKKIKSDTDNKPKKIKSDMNTKPKKIKSDTNNKPRKIKSDKSTTKFIKKKHDGKTNDEILDSLLSLSNNVSKKTKNIPSMLEPSNHENVINTENYECHKLDLENKNRKPQKEPEYRSEMIGLKDESRSDKKIKYSILDFKF